MGTTDRHLAAQLLAPVAPAGVVLDKLARLAEVRRVLRGQLKLSREAERIVAAERADAAREGGGRG